MATKSFHTDSVANAVTANRKVFIPFCFIGIAFISGGLLSLRLDKKIHATGYVLAGEERYVFAPAQGVLDVRHVSIGDTVAAGDPLFSLEADRIDLQILEKMRELAESRNRLREAELAVRQLEVRPADAGVLTAGERLELFRKIRDIQSEISEAWERLEGERAVRGLEYNLQRVEALRTQLEELNVRVMAGWAENGLPAIGREQAEQAVEAIRERREVLAEELALLKQHRADLTVEAPIGGTVVDIYRRYPGMAIEEGERVLKIARMNGDYRVKAYVGQRNVDLLRAGGVARMESGVFDSMFEDYVYGRVLRIVADATRGEEEPRYEVTIQVEETPYPLVLGSEMEVDFVLGRQSLMTLLLNRRDDSR